MNMKQAAKTNPWIHPILLGFYPVLALYVFNRNEIVFPAIRQAVITSCAVAFCVIAAFLLIFRHWSKAAIASSLAFLLFFSYGHVFDLLQSGKGLGEIAGHHRFTLPLWLFFLTAGLVLIFRAKNTAGLNNLLNSIAIFLMVFLCMQLLVSSIQSKVSERNFSNEISNQDGISEPMLTDRDVYYILVDAYSRADLLQDELDLDTSSFIAELKELGFYIPNCAQSNYNGTVLSLSSTLNMDYLNSLGLDYRADKAVFEPYIQKNLAMTQFKELGYSTVTFKSQHPILDIQDSTYYYDYHKNGSTLDAQAALNFQYLFLRTTLLRPLVQFIESNPGITVPPFWSNWIPTNNTLLSRDYRQYQQNVFALDSLQNIPDLPGKKFVYAHLYTTHQPYVFYADGRFHPLLAQDSQAYRDQVIFANKRLIEIVKTILAKSNPAPIIVMQGDHSYFRQADSIKILNAYYLPDGGNGYLYQNVTPVNTFRIIFNTYFDGHYPLLPDKSYYVDDADDLHETPITCMEN
jgi:hypothetical protein